MADQANVKQLVASVKYMTEDPLGIGGSSMILVRGEMMLPEHGLPALRTIKLKGGRFYSSPGLRVRYDPA